jgi:putative transport protein
MLQANISRIRRGERVFAATTDVVLEAGDIVMVVGSADELDKMGFVLGQEVDAPMDINTTVASLDVEMTEQSLAGQTLAQARVWERYGVVITRLRREGLEIAPKGNVALEIGDSLRVVGEREAVDRFVGLVHGSGHRADETNMVPFLAGLVLGILAGNVGLHLGGNLDMKLGTAGGVFIVSLLVGHVGRIGRFRLYVPAAARNLSRELGLALFLAGAGTDAGARLLPIIRERGWSLLLAGACITTVAVLAGLCLMVVWFGKRMNSFEIMGALCAAMTNPPALSAASGQTTTGVPAFAYASVYPVALILKILLAQVLVEVLRLL